MLEEGEAEHPGGCEVASGQHLFSQKREGKSTNMFKNDTEPHCLCLVRLKSGWGNN